MYKAIISIATLLFDLVCVKGHGYVQQIDIGSASYTGYLPYSDPYYNPPPERIVRKIPGNGMSSCISAIVGTPAEWTDMPFRPSARCHLNRVRVA